MKKHIYDEKTSLSYEQRGEQYYPVLKAPKLDLGSVGIWGYRRYRYLREFKYPTFLNTQP